MINIKQATLNNSSILALLGRITYAESHGHFITDKNDLSAYLNETFSVAKTTKELKDPNTIFYIIYVDDFPAGYAKIVLNSTNENVTSNNNCKLERIYILNDFIPLKLGKQLLNFIINKTKELHLDTLWLSVYVKNERAIKFYQKNDFINVGEFDFLVNQKIYKNFVFAKNIES